MVRMADKFTMSPEQHKMTTLRQLNCITSHQPCVRTTMHPQTALYLSDIFVSNTQVEDMDVAPVTSGACITTKPASKLHCLETQCTKGRVDLVCSKSSKAQGGVKVELQSFLTLELDGLE
jgi:hypothetical protein